MSEGKYVSKEMVAALEAEVRAEFPGWEIVKKTDSPLMKTIAKVMFFNKSFMVDFVTSFGSWMWVPTDWDAWPNYVKAEIIRHERMHFRQQAKWGFPAFAFLYLLCPLPLGYAYWRATFEKEGYAESIRAHAEYAGLEKTANDKALREFIISQFTGPNYGWMWPFQADLDAWYDGVIAQLRKETASGK